MPQVARCVVLQLLAVFQHGGKPALVVLLAEKDKVVPDIVHPVMPRGEFVLDLSEEFFEGAHWYDLFLGC